MVDILFSGGEPLEQIVYTHLTESTIRNLVKIVHAFFREIFKDDIFFYYFARI